MNESKDVPRRESSQNGRYAGRYSKQVPARRKRRKVNPLFIAVVALAAILIGLIIFLIIGSNKQDNALVGTWKYDQYTEYEFYDNGKGCLCVDDVHYEYKYKISGDKLTLDFTEDVVRDCEYTFTVDDKGLTLVGGEGTDKGTYQLSKISQHYI